MAQTDVISKAFDYCNYAFTSYFAMEMLLKLFADGFKHYVAHRMNVFDGLVVTMR